MNKALSPFLCAALLLAACSHRTDASAENFTTGLHAYLEQRGDLCLGKTWPVVVSEQEAQHGSRNALQMPVLEKLGLVSASPVMVEAPKGDSDAPPAPPVMIPGRRYELTEAARRYVRQRPSPIGADRTPHDDLCAARLSLDRVVKFEPAGKNQERPAQRVSYTYSVDAAPWTADPSVAPVFPMIDRVIRGSGRAELQETFVLTDRGWVAQELLE
jgi:hypothetical protein